MSRTRSFFNGAIFAYLYQACAMVIGLWLTPFYIRTLGTHDYGIWLVGLQVLTFMLLCDFGIMAVLPRDIAQANGLEQSQADSERLAIMIAQTIKVVLVQTLLIGLVALGLFLFRPTGAPGLRGPIALILIVFTVSYPLRLFPAILQGLQHLTFLGQLRLWLWAFSTALVVVLLFLGARFYALACGWCLQQMGHDLFAYLWLRRIRPDLVASDVLKKAGPFQWRWFTRGFWVSVSQAAYSLVAGTDLLIIARFLGPATVVVYSTTSKLITVLQNQPQTLAAVALPGLSHMKTSEPRERILQATTSLTQAMLLLVGGVFCIILSINQQFVTLWLGERFFGGMQLTTILLLNFLVRQIDYTLAIALFAFGYEKFIALRALIEGIVGVALASLLVRHFELAGVALGFLCVTLVFAVPTDAFLLSREFKVSIFQVIRPYMAYLWRFAVVGCFGLALKAWLPATNMFYVAITALLVGLAYLLIVLPYVWKTPLRGYIQSTAATLTSAIRGRMLGWSNHG
jgi:O-antigen/teichoic acid export membrane protein